MKKCVRCKNEYQLENFPELSIATDGHNSYCRRCFEELVAEESPKVPLQRQKVFKLGIRERLRRRVISLRYLARKKQAEGTFTAKDVENLLAQQKYECAYCGADLHRTGFHVDHVKPLSKGGSNWPSNLACACPSCNTSKRDNDLDTWRTRP